MAIHTLGFFSLGAFSATNGVAPNPVNGLTVGGAEWGGAPPADTTISFDYDAITTLEVDSEHTTFTDDPWNPEWTGASWPQHTQENAGEVTINGTTYAPGTLQLENEYEVILTGSDGNEYNLVAVSAVGLNPNSSGPWDYIDFGQQHGVIGFTFQGDWPPEGVALTFVQNVDGEQIDWDVFVPPEEIPCFTRGTMILTERGEVAIEDLRAGDLVMTRDHGLQPIRWIGSKKLGPLHLVLSRNLRPIRIKAGALGDNQPAQDLTVSPQHRILVRSRIALKMFGTDEVLVAAKQLLQVEGVNVVTDADSVEYFHMLFDQHEVVFSNGAETESLYTGPEALKSLPRAAVSEIFALFPELQDESHTPNPARLLASGRTGRKLAIRHVQNSRVLVAH